MRLSLLFLSCGLLRADVSTPVFATYLGGSGNEVVSSVTTDGDGNIYVAGRTDSPDFPVRNAIQSVSRSYSQIFVAKLSPAGELLYSTYFGGSANDLASSIAADPAGNVYVTGALQSKDFPVSNASQPISGGAVDAFVLKLDRDGHVLYSTYLGGQFNDLGFAVTADSLGNAYVTGRTESPDFPITAGVFQPQPAGYKPGSRFTTAFVTKLDPAGNIVYSSFLGGSSETYGWSVAVDALGQAHVAGQTVSANFPVTANAMQTLPGRPSGDGLITSDGFLTKISADGSRLIYSTLVGGPLDDSARSVAVDTNGNAYITGTTSDARLPIVGGSQQYLGGDVYLISEDGGGTFTPQRSGLAAAQVTAIAFDPGIPGLVYAGTLQGVFRSSDGGQRWTPAGLEAFTIRSLLTEFSEPGTLYAGTDRGGGIFRSSDGGETWMSLNSGFPAAARAVFRSLALDSSGAVYTIAGSDGIGCCSDQPVYKLTADGTTWTLLGHGLRSTTEALAVSPKDSSLYVGSARFSFFNVFATGSTVPGTVFRRTADSWIQSDIDDDIRALAFAGGTLFAAGQKFYRSVDGGQTWISSVLPGTQLATQIVVDVRNPATIYVLAGGVLRSDDGGQTFHPISTPPVTALAVNPFDSSLHAGTSASSDAYVMAFDPNGALLYSTFAGDSASEEGEGIAVDSAGHVYLVGFRSAGSFPLGNFGRSYDGSAYMTRIGENGFTVDIGASTSALLLGMPGAGVTVAPDGSIVAVMIATAGNLPVVNAVQPNLNGDSDIYIAKWKP